MNDTKQDNLEPIVNRIANSGIETINLADYLPETEILELDIKDFLFKGLLLKEKDFRDHLKTHDWQQYNDKIVAVYCSSDALVQQWAYMLIASKLMNAQDVIFGTKDEVKEKLLVENLRSFKAQDFESKRVMIRGCGDEKIDSAAYLEITNKLLPHVKSLFYGEACSNVPIYKKKK